MSGFVGVFDSGVGGISVLRSLVAELPHEDFHYFGDSANAPYGEKTEARVLELSQDIVERFVADGAKAIVIACNTATSADAPTLRRIYPDLPIIGIEPALKPATEAPGHGRILVMATDITLRLDKYQELAATYGRDCEVISVPCPGLAGRIERRQIAEVLGGDVCFYDGGAGTARQLRHRLGECGLLADEVHAGSASFASSEDTPDELALYREFFEMEL